MSRLDDELRVAFRRVEPSSDFAERVIGRINNGQVNNGRANNPLATRPSLWQRLKSFLEPPVARWVAVGVATSLLVAIFASQYRRLQDVTPEHQSAPGIAERAPEIAPAPLTQEQIPQERLPQERLPQEQRQQTVRHQPVRNRTGLNRNLLARQRKERQHQIEAEQAKEQLLLALQIASSTLNEANKMVRGDD